MDFLGEREYKAILYADVEETDYETNPGAYTIIRYQVDKAGSLDLEPARGFAIPFKGK